MGLQSKGIFDNPKDPMINPDNGKKKDVNEKQWNKYLNGMKNHERENPDKQDGNEHIPWKTAPENRLAQGLENLGIHSNSSFQHPQKLIRNVTSRNDQVLNKRKSGNGIYYQLLRADNLFS